MGSLLGPALADYLMADLECQSMTPQHISMPVFYSRYVDDIFPVFDIRICTKNLYFLNNLRPNMKFTYEIGPHDLAFLDILISLSSNNDFSLIRNVCMKQTDTKAIIRFNAVFP